MKIQQLFSIKGSHDYKLEDHYLRPRDISFIHEHVKKGTVLIGTTDKILHAIFSDELDTLARSFDSTGILRFDSQQEVKHPAGIELEADQDYLLWFRKERMTNIIDVHASSDPNESRITLFFDTFPLHPLRDSIDLDELIAELDKG